MKKLPQNKHEMSYIKYEVNLPLIYVQNIKISVYVENLHDFNFSFWEYMLANIVISIWYNASLFWV